MSVYTAQLYAFEHRKDGKLYSHFRIKGNAYLLRTMKRKQVTTEDIPESVLAALQASTKHPNLRIVKRDGSVVDGMQTFIIEAV